MSWCETEAGVEFGKRGWLSDGDLAAVGTLTWLNALIKSTSG